MKLIKRVGLLSAVFIILFISIVSAGVAVNSDSIKRDYVAGENISGKINLNISSEKSDILISDSFGNERSLLNILGDYEEGIDYKCTIMGCGKKYEIKNQISGNSVSIINNSIIGFKITGGAIGIVSVFGNIHSNVPSSCNPQLSIDFMDKGEHIISNPYYEDTPCASKDYGCFNVDDNSERQKAIVSGSELCEVINLKTAPAYRVGARITNTSAGQGELKMRLYDMNQSSLGECILPALNSSEQDVSCIITNNEQKNKDAYACIIADGGNYRIRIEDSAKGNVCGTDDRIEGIGQYDYEIFAFPLKYAKANYSIEEDILQMLMAELTVQMSV